MRAAALNSRSAAWKAFAWISSRSRCSARALAWASESNVCFKDAIARRPPSPIEPADSSKRPLSSSARTFLRRLHGTTRRDVIHELTVAACSVRSCDPQAAEQTVLAREETTHTGIGYGIAVPHARIDGLAEPVVAAGISEPGIDFDAPDGAPAHLVFLVLTPREDDGAQLEILAAIGHAFRSRRALERAMQAHSLTEFLAVIKGESAESAA